MNENCGKGAWLRQRMELAGHTAAQTPQETDLLLLDCDWPWAGDRVGLIDACIGHGARVALYPHGGMPTVFNYDGLAAPDERVSLRLEHGMGSVEMAAMFADEPLHQAATGWLFCPTADFQPCPEPKRVLFAPMHPNIEALVAGTNGHDPAPKLNQAVYRDLLDTGYEIKVSTVGPAHRNGVWPHPRATFADNSRMMFQESYHQILAADVVVAAGTIGAAAVALGKPTVMLGQGDYRDYVGGQYVEAANAGVYRDYARYPLDVEDGTLDELLLRACQGDTGAAEWRERFVGDDGSLRAVELLERLVGQENQQRNATVSGVTALARGR